MSLIAFVNFKSSPGATTAVLALAHVWPAGRDLLVVEADPAGGDIAARSGISSEPGLASLAAAGRRAISTDLINEHLRSVGGIPTLLAPPSPTASIAALKTAGTTLALTLSELESDVLVDCGRFEPGSVATPMIENADLIVVVTRPTVGELPRVASSIRELGKRVSNACLLLTEGSHPDRGGHYPAAEVAEAVGVGVSGMLPCDHHAASMLWGAPGNPGSLERSPLIRSARAVAAIILGKLDTQRIAAQSWIGQDLSLPLLRRAVPGER